MGFRRLKAKKYRGISEYYRDKDPDKRTISYYIDYRDIDGAPKKEKTDAKDRDEALLILKSRNTEIARVKDQIDRGEALLEQKILNRTLTLDELALMFHAQRNNKNAKEDEKKYHNHISPVLGTMKIAKIGREQIFMLKEALETKENDRYKVVKNYESGTKESVLETYKLSPKTVRDIIEYLRVIFNWAIAENFLLKNPVVIKKIVNQTEDTEPGRVMTDEELETLWNLNELKMNDRLYLFLKTCYFTGARPAGVIEIQVKHINFAAKKIKIRAMKGGKSYEAPASNELLSLFESWIKKHDLKHDNFIFYPIQSYMRANTKVEKEAFKNKHANYSGYQRALREIFDPVFNIGIDPYDRMYRVTVYTMKRTAGTKIYKAHGIIHAMKFLNHTDVKTTMKYLNITDDIEVMTDAL